jgi:hypothetical protein
VNNLAINRSGEFHYNLRNELVSGERYGEKFSYSFNHVGNFIKNSELSKSEEFIKSDETSIIPLGTKSSPYQFNELGELIKGGKVLENRFNGLGQLIYTRTANTESFYGYDASGLRIYKKVVDLSNNSNQKISLFPTESLVINQLAGKV